MGMPQASMQPVHEKKPKWLLQQMEHPEHLQERSTCVDLSEKRRSSSYLRKVESSERDLLVAAPDDEPLGAQIRRFTLCGRQALNPTSPRAAQRPADDRMPCRWADGIIRECMAVLSCVSGALGTTVLVHETGLN